MIKLVTAKSGDAEMLSSLFQKYLYDMSRYYDSALDEDGNYPYPYLPLYFTGSDRQAWFIYDDDTLVGFALINTHSFVESEAEHALAEFTIFPAYRSRGYAAASAKELFARLPGTWQLKFSTNNTPAARFWRKLLTPYGAREHDLGGGETAVSFRA